MVVDRFADLEAFGSERRKFNALYREKTVEVGGGEAGRTTTRIRLLKPQTYMNLSGSAVRDFLGYFGLTPRNDLTDDLLVIYDDLDLPPGKLRFRKRGSAAGHRGLVSVLDSLGHERFSRLKLGIGRRHGAESPDYVLEVVDRQTREVLDAAVSKSVGTLRVWIEEGITVCMNRFNGDPETPKDVEEGQEIR